jgi:DNA ligase (NAD+)
MKNLIGTNLGLLSDNQVSELVTYLNSEYRLGNPAVSDEEFDSIYLPLLAERIPDHPLVIGVQPESIDGKNTVTHRKPMLSTDKAYSKEEIQAYIDRCEKAALDAGIELPLQYRVLPKLDGLAVAVDNMGTTFASRGNGLVGNNLTDFINKGVNIIGLANFDTPGELVVKQSYFTDALSADFKHPRNFVAGISGADNISDAGLKALSDGAIDLVLFRDLPSQLVYANELIERLDELCEAARTSVDYLTDGTIIEVNNTDLRTHMGHNDHHHHWQIAKKSKGETADVKVLGIEWQTGRNNITPVLSLEPTLLSGAVISKVTAHHAGNVKSLGLGAGAVISLIRSGEVIPEILSVKTSVLAEIPESCPCCNEPVKWENDFIHCVNDNCKSRLASALKYHFKLIGANLFGSKTCEKLVDAGLTTIGSVYCATNHDFINAGLGSKQAENIINELNRIKSTPVDDYLILAALGIHACGRGTSKRILKTMTIHEIENATYEHLLSLKGFAEITAKGISNGIVEKMAQINFLSNWLTVKQTKKDVDPNASALPLSGLNLVFTGKMSMSRGQMSEHAESRGGTVQSSVGKTTSFLVIGENVGATKIAAAEKKNVKVITLDEYFAKAG